MENWIPSALIGLRLRLEMAYSSISNTSVLPKSEFVLSYTVGGSCTGKTRAYASGWAEHGLLLQLAVDWNRT